MIKDLCMHIYGKHRLKVWLNRNQLKDNHVFFRQYSIQWSLINWCQVFKPHDFAVFFYEITLVASDAMADEWNKRGIDSPQLINVLSTLAWHDGDVSHVKPLARVNSTVLSWETSNFISMRTDTNQTKAKSLMTWTIQVEQLMDLGL